MIAGSIPVCGPTSLVAAEIHLGRRPAGICGGWLHCNIQVACHSANYNLSIFFNILIGENMEPTALLAANLRQPA